MRTAPSRGAFTTAPAARPRPLRPLLAAAYVCVPAVARHSSLLGRFVQQLQHLKHSKVWNGHSTGTSHNAQSSARGSRQLNPTRQPAGTDGGARPGAGGGRHPGIVWFRGDLRLHDNEALSRAQAECSSLVPVYCFDPRDYGKSPQGYDKTGPYRAQFLAEAVADLRAALRAAGSDLIVRVGRPEEMIGELVRRTGAAAVYCHTEVTYEELRTEAAVKAAAEAAGAGMKCFWTNTLCHLDDLPFRPAQLPQNFDKFRERIEGVAVRAALPAPGELRGLPLGGRIDAGDIPTLQQLGLQPLSAGNTSKWVPASSSGRSSKASITGEGGTARGGEGEALRQLQHFLSQATSCSRGAGGAPGAAYGSNFASSIAPWLATGCLSPRRMLEAAQRAMTAAPVSATSAAMSAAATKAQAPLDWVRFELYWRDFFRFLSLRYSSIANAKLGCAASANAPSATAAMAAA